MNIRQLEYFVSLSETSSFTKTAQDFFISQTAVTKSIKLLEQSLDTTLFNRNKHYVELTPAGNVFLLEAKTILQKIAEATERVHLTTIGFVGLLRIGFIKGYEHTSFTDIIYQLYNQYPNISITLFRGTEKELNDKIAKSELDIVFSNLAKNDVNTSVGTYFIKRYSSNIIVHPTHPYAKRKSLFLKELNAETIFSYSEDQDIESILLKVSANMGIAILPSYCVRYLNQSQHLMIISLEDNSSYIDIAAIWNKENCNPALPRLIQIMKNLKL